MKISSNSKEDNNLIILFESYEDIDLDKVGNELLSILLQFIDSNCKIERYIFVEVFYLFIDFIYFI